MKVQPFNIPGMISALSLDGGLVEIGPVVAFTDRQEIEQLVNSIQWIRNHKPELEGKSPIAAPIDSDLCGWKAITYLRDRSQYCLNLRGVTWLAPQELVHDFINKAAIPYLARGTTFSLISKFISHRQ